jgi:putative ABC transport system permease protein
VSKDKGKVLPDLIFRLRALFRRHAVERELDDELRLHVDHEIEKYVKAGVSRPDAVRRARLALGGLEQIKEECRDARGVSVVESTLQDVRYALRTMGKAPAFATMAVLCLALGIGANTAIFTLIDAVMLRRLPVRSPDELISVGDPARPTALWEGAPMLEVLSYPLYERLRDHNRVVSGLLASGRAGRIELADEDGGGEVRGRFVSANYFEVLGISLAAGRAFAESDGNVGADPVAVISHTLWEGHFARGPRVVGRTVRLNRRSFTIVGVAPKSFTGEVVGSPTDIWLPLSAQPFLQGQSRLHRSDSNWLLALGRLAPGVSLDRARAEFRAIAQQALPLSVPRAPQLPVGPGARGFSWVRKNVAAALFTLMAVVGLVLMIACANVANLLLARAASRQREIAVRLAIGASRRRLIRQLVTEGALLAGLGGLAALVVATWGSRVLSHLLSRGGPNPVPFDVDVQPNLVVLAFTAGLCLLTTMVFALVPAGRATRVELSPALKDGGRGTEGSGRTWGKVLVIGQLALSVPLLMTAGLLVRSLTRLETLDVGYSRDNLLVMRAELDSSIQTKSAARWPRVNRVVDRIRAIPGVQDVTVSENGLFSAIDSSTQSLQIEGLPSSRPEATHASFDQIAPGYFHVVGIPVLAGREFDDRDAAGAQTVAIINDMMARFYFGDRSPLGRVIQNGNDRYTIVGVVADHKQRDLAGTIERRFYLPLLQSSDAMAMVHVSVRTSVDAMSLVSTIRRDINGLEASVNVTSIESVATLMNHSLSGERSVAQLAGLFAVLAFALAAAGLYGVTAYAAARRTNEIGLRVALGASRGGVIRMVLRDALTLVAGGLAIGLPLALITPQLVAARIDGAGRIDPTVFLVVIAMMLTVGVCAAGIPAWRASRVDPVTALRHE